MPTADSSQVQVGYQRETSYGVLPGSPDLLLARYTSESLHSEAPSSASSEIGAGDRQTTDLIRTGLSASGDIGMEFSYHAFDDWLKAVLMDAVIGGRWDWRTGSSANPTVTDIDNAEAVTVAAPSGGVTNISIPIGPWSTIPVAGDWVRLSNFANAANNSIWKVTGTPTGTSIDLVDAAGIMIAETGGGTTVVQLGDQITNGTSLASFLIEKVFTDLSAPIVTEQNLGMAFDALQMSVTSDGIVTGTWGLVGAKSQSAAALFDATPAAAPGFNIMNGISNVPIVREAGLAYNIIEWTMDMKNNLRARLQVGTLGAVSLGNGNIEITGTLKAYFGSSTIMDKFLNDTTSSLVLYFNDSSGNGYVVDLPAIKYSSGQRVVTGQNADIIADMGFTAFRSATDGKTIRVTRFAA